jgi:hypothetical protein
MAKRFGYHIFLGVLIGTVFGFGLGSANGIPLLGLEIGAFFGAFIGWFLAAADLQQH